MEIALAAATSPRVPFGATALVPVGSTEQHGPHLPLDTDTEIAVAVAESAAKMLRRRRLSVVVARRSHTVPAESTKTSPARFPTGPPSCGRS